MTTLTEKQTKVSNLLSGNTKANYLSIYTNSKLNFEAISLKLAIENNKANFADLLPKVTETLKPLYIARMQTNEVWLTKRFNIYTKIAIKQRNAITNATAKVKKVTKKVTKKVANKVTNKVSK